MKVASDITAKQTYGKQLKLPSEIELDEVKKLAKSMDNRLQEITEEKGHYIKISRVKRLIILFCCFLLYRCRLIFDDIIIFHSSKIWLFRFAK